jgi:CubicO group peptidase (beta-lactamase class C family)
MGERPSPRPRALADAVDRVVTTTGFSGAVHVSRGGTVLYERARGLADRALGVENRIGTRFAVASVTKGFTALGVMALVEDGRLATGDPVRAVVDGLDVDPGVTVEHLLAHTSGIGDYLDESLARDVDAPVLAVPGERLACPADFRSLLGGHPAKFAPGDRFEYCNGGYVILALVVEAASGLGYHEVLDERVFRPAGMASTGFPRLDALPPSAAVGYVPDGDGWRPNTARLPVRGAGDGGAYSTVADLAAFWPALLEGRIVAPGTVAEMIRPRHDVPSESLRYGLGFWLRADRDTVMLEGYDAGISCRTAFDPASRLHYTVVANTSAGAWPVVRFLDDMLPDLAAAG